MEENENQKEDESIAEEPTSPEEPGETGEKGLGEFVTASMRGPKRGIYQQLLAQLLIKANRTNDPLIKIASICETALTSRQKDKLDMNHVEVCYAVCRSFLNTQPELGSKITRVAWSFPQTEENWEKYVNPWHRTSFCYCPLETRHRHNNYPEKRRYGEYVAPWQARDRANKYFDYLDELENKVHKEICELPMHEAFFGMTSALTKEGYQILEGEFTGWALRQLLETQAIISEEIDPQVWREAQGIFAQEQEEEES